MSAKVCTEEEIRAKIAYLKETFQRKKKDSKLKSGSGSSDYKDPEKWSFYKYVQNN